MTKRKTRLRRTRKAANHLDIIELELTREALRLAKKRKPFYIT